MKQPTSRVTIQTITQAAKRIRPIVKKTPLQPLLRLSEAYGASIFVKREDLQDVRSYKIRGAYNLMSSLTKEERSRGVVCASAGNHAQGVAFSAQKLKIRATIFMPTVTTLQKISKVKRLGGSWVEVNLAGNTYDESCTLAHDFCDQTKAVFVHAFDDPRVISGQGTVGKEIFDELEDSLDVVLCPIGGGGLISGVATYLKAKNKRVKIIGVEPSGAASMNASITAKKVVTLPTLDPFVDGVAVRTVGKQTYAIASKLIDEIAIIPEGAVCATMIDLYQQEGIIAEPAGALAIAALDYVKEEIKGKTVVCILSGGNNDILRYPEIMEKSLVHQGRKHYFLITFAQKPGQLRNFLNNCLGPTDDIVRFEYIKKNAKEKGPALVGLELARKEDLAPLLAKMDAVGLAYTRITDSDLLYSYLI